MSDCTFLNNEAKCGGAVYNFCGSLNAINSTFCYSNATTGGGAIFSGNGSLTLLSVSVRDNSALQGGGILSGGEESLTITDCTFSTNKAENGGAIASVAGQTHIQLSQKMQRPKMRRPDHKDVGVLNISKSTFSGNTGETSGGAIMVATGTINVKECQFHDNRVSDGDGGAIGIDTHGTVLVSDSILAGNTAKVNGGAFGGNGKASITNCDIEKNEAENGGALACYNEMRIVDSNVRKNSASYGGAIFCSGGTMKVATTTLSDNSAEYGGAIFNYGILSIERTAITGNSAEANGGAIGCTKDGTITILNSTLSANSAGTCGGGLLVFQATAKITFVTLANNRAETGGGVFTSHGRLDVVNSIIANNQGGDSHGPLNQNVRNLIQDGSGNPSLSGDPLLSALIGSPAFHPLMKGSPAIGAAHPDYHEPIDQRGTPRPQGDGIDIGAFELVPDA